MTNYLKWAHCCESCRCHCSITSGCLARACEDCPCHKPKECEHEWGPEVCVKCGWSGRGGGGSGHTSPAVQEIEELPIESPKKIYTLDTVFRNEMELTLKLNEVIRALAKLSKE